MSDWLPRLVEWWVGTAVGGGSLLLAACLAMRGRGGAAFRQRFGEWAVVAALAVAVLRLAPAWIPVPLSNEAEPAVVPPMLVWAEAPVPPCEPAPVCDAPAVWTAACSPEPPPAAPHWPSLGTVLLLSYFGVGGTLAARWLLGQWALARMLRRAKPAAGRLRAVFQSIDGSNGVRLLISDKVPVPICCGLWRPTVVLPRPLADSADETTLRWVLVHELTHLRRRDPWASWAMGLAAAVYFYQPWFWWLRRQVRLCQEYVADAAAAAQARWPDEYAQFLLTYAKAPAAPLGATGAWGHSSDLYRRVTMLLQSPRGQADCPRRWTRIAAGSLLGLAVIVSGVGLKAEEPKKSAEPQIEIEVVATADDKPAEKGQAAKEVKVKRVISINGVPIEVPLSAEDAEKLEAKIREAIGKGDGQQKVFIRRAANAEEARKLAEEAKARADELRAKMRVNPEGIRKQVEEALKNVKGVDAAEIEKQIAEAMKNMQVDVDFKWDAMPGAAAMGGVPMMAAVRRNEGRLGVMVEKPSEAMCDQLDLPKDQGLVVREIVADSAAAKAGLKANDILLEIGGKPVPSEPAGLVKLLAAIEAPKTVEAVVLRKGKKETVKNIELPEVKKAARAQMMWVTPDGDVLKPAQGQQPALPGVGVLKRVDGEKVAKNVNRSVIINDGSLTIRETDGDLTITVTGKATGSKMEVESIVINDGGKKVVAGSVDDVPAQYRARVKELTGGQTVQWRFEKSGGK